ncbi:MAG: hypothetical protein ACYCU7_10060 [Acidimicrobiales bacterium]
MRARPTRWATTAIVVLALVAFAAVAFFSSGGLGTSGTPRQQLAQWATSTSFGATVGTLHDDDRHVATTVAGHPSTGALHTVCAVLTDDAGSANGQLPTPLSSLTQLLAHAYALEYAAGSDCYAAAGGNHRLLSTSARLRAQAESLLDQALATVRRVTGLAVPTTTTTQPGGGGIF